MRLSMVGGKEREIKVWKRVRDTLFGKLNRYVNVRQVLINEWCRNLLWG